MSGPISKEDCITVVDEGCGVVQRNLPPSVVLIVSSLIAEPPVFEGMGMCVVLLGTRGELVECIRMWVGVHQWSQWCVGFMCNGYTEGSGELSDEGGLKDMQLIIEGEV